MKLTELGLKTKPATKYVENGYISFSTQNKNLFHEIHQVTKTINGVLYRGEIRSKDYLDALLKSKTMKDVINALPVEGKYT